MGPDVTLCIDLAAAITSAVGDALDNEQFTALVTLRQNVEVKFVYFVSCVFYIQVSLATNAFAVIGEQKDSYTCILECLRLYPSAGALHSRFPRLSSSGGLLPLPFEQIRCHGE